MKSDNGIARRHSCQTTQVGYLTPPCAFSFEVLEVGKLIDFASSSSAISNSHLNFNYNIPFLTPKRTSFSTFLWQDEPTTRNYGSSWSVG